jgi:hypothetical protein
MEYAVPAYVAPAHPDIRKSQGGQRPPESQSTSPSKAGAAIQQNAKNPENTPPRQERQQTGNRQPLLSGQEGTRIHHETRSKLRNVLDGSRGATDQIPSSQTQGRRESVQIRPRESKREKGIIVKAISIEEERNSQKAQEEKERGGRNGRKRIAYEKSRKMTDNDEKKKRQEIRERNQVIQDLAEKLRDRKNWEAHRRDKRREKERYKERAYEEFTKAALPDQDDKSADQYYQDGEETYEETYNDITEAKVAIRQEEIAKNKKHYEKEIEAAEVKNTEDLEKKRLTDIAERYHEIVEAIMRREQDEESALSLAAETQPKERGSKADIKDKERAIHQKEDHWTRVGLKFEAETRRGPKRKR